MFDKETARPGECRAPPGRRTTFFVYLLTSQPHGTLYVGMTDDLIRRIWEHKNKVVPGFTAKYGVDRLVWFEAHETREGAWELREADQRMAAGLENSDSRGEQPHWTDLYSSLSPWYRPSNELKGGSRLSPGLRFRGGS